MEERGGRQFVFVMAMLRSVNTHISCGIACSLKKKKHLGNCLNRHHL